MSVAFVTHDARPEIREEETLWRQWPAFMLHDAAANERWGALYERFGAFQFWGIDEADGETVVKANCVPVALDVDALPAGGWREALCTAVDDADRAPTVLCALGITVGPEYRGRGLSRRMIQRMAEIGRDHGLDTLIAPVRPTLKHVYPLTPMERYVSWRRPDGSHLDPWLRTHERLGAEIVKVAPRSVIVSGTVAQWEEWTGMALPARVAKSSRPRSEVTSE